jgi:hypothetical protein
VSAAGLRCESPAATDIDVALISPAATDIDAALISPAATRGASA